MLPVYICDDNKTQLTYITQIINNTILIDALDASCVCSVSSPSRLLSYLSKHPAPSLYFLDIELGEDMNGFSLAQEIRKYDPRGFIVFITAYEDLSPFIFKYKLEAMDYIIKDNPDELVPRVRECLQRALELYIAPANTIQKAIGVKADGRIVSLQLSEIFCIETSTQAHKIRIYKRDDHIELFDSLKNIKQLLDEDFFQCHKSCIINLRHIKEINKKDYTVTLENERICPVSTRLMQSLSSLYS